MATSLEMNEFLADNQAVVNNIHAAGFDSKADQTTALAVNYEQQDCRTGMTIIEISQTNAQLKAFLIATGNYWPTDGHWTSILYKCHYLFTRLAILGCVAYGVVGLTFLGLDYSESTQSAIDFPIYIALFLASCSVLPAQYLNRFRVTTPLTAEEIQSLEASLSTTIAFAVASAVTTVAAIVVECIHVVDSGGFFDFAWVVPHFYVALVLSYNMLFFMLDLHASEAILQQLHNLADQRLLTLDKFAWARTEIESRVRRSRWASDFIIVPCLASAVGIVVTVLLVIERSTNDDGQNQTLELDGAGIVLCLLKELIYLFVAFWAVARVNELADDLTVKLSEGFWGKYNFADIESVQTPDLHRLSIHASGVSKPIGYSLIFKRVNKRNVLLSALGFAITILAGLIRTSIGQ